MVCDNSNGLCAHSSLNSCSHVTLTIQEQVSPDQDVLITLWLSADSMLMGALHNVLGIIPTDPGYNYFLCIAGKLYMTSA